MQRDENQKQIVSRRLVGRRALVTGATVYVDGGLTLYPAFLKGG